MQKLKQTFRDISLVDGGWPYIRKVWSWRLALFWGAFNGALLGLAVFADVLPPKVFLALNVFGYATIAVARVIKQPGAEV